MKLRLTTIININLSIYIFTLYVFTYQDGLNNVSNAFAASLVILIWINHITQNKIIIFNKFLVFYLLFILFSIFSTFSALDIGLTIISLRTLLLLFILMFSLINYIDNMTKLRIVIKSFIVSGLIATIYIIASSDLSNLVRLGRQLGNVNAIGLHISVSAVFLLYLYYDNKKIRNIFGIILLIIMILLTGSRKSLIYVVLGILFLSFIKYNNTFSSKVKFLIFSIPLLVGAGYIVFTVPIFYDVIGTRLFNLYEGLFGGGTTEGSFNTRILMTDLGWKWFLEKPLFGYGLDNYRLLYESYTGLNTYSHNNVIELLVGIGVFGTFFFYISYINVMINLVKISRIKSYKLISFSFFILIFGYIILSPSLVFYDGKIITILVAISSVIPLIIENVGSNNVKKNTNYN